MKQVRQLCATTLLIVVLAASPALAGDMECGVTSPAPPPAESSVTGYIPYGVTSSSTSSETSVTGNMPFGMSSEIDPVTGLALSLLQSLLSLF